MSSFLREDLGVLKFETEPAAREIFVCHANLEITVFVLSHLMQIFQIEALLAQTSSLLFPCHLPSCPFMLHFGCPFSVLSAAEWSSLLSLYQTLGFNVLVFYIVLLKKDHLFVSSAYYLFWGNSSFAYLSYVKINMLPVLKGGRRLSPCV